MTGKNLLTVVDKGQACIQISIVTEQGLHELVLELVVHEQSIVRFKEDRCTVFFRTVFGDVAHQLSFFEGSLSHLSIAIARHLETAAQGIYRLQTDTVQTNALLERLGIVLTTGIQLADCLDELALRDLSSFRPPS